MAENELDQFAENFVAIKDYWGMSQAVVAQRCRENGLDTFHPTTVARIESGQRKLRAAELAPVASALLVPVAFLSADPDFVRHALELHKALEEAHSAAAEWVSANDRLASAREEIRRILDSGTDERRFHSLGLGEIYEDALAFEGDDDFVRYNADNWRGGGTPFVSFRS